MEDKKILKYIKLGFAAVIIVLSVISFCLLPDKVGVQISVSGQLQNYIPKALAVIIPIGVYALGFLPSRNGQKEDWKRFLIISIVALLIQVCTLFLNI